MSRATAYMQLIIIFLIFYITKITNPEIITWEITSLVYIAWWIAFFIGERNVTQLNKQLNEQHDEQLKLVHEKLDRTLEEFDGLRKYLYEIDPQFDDEREFRRAIKTESDRLNALDTLNVEDESMFSSIQYNWYELMNKKRDEKKRTLKTPLVSDHNEKTDNYSITGLF